MWKTDYSQGIVVKVDGDDDYYIVMECSSKNKGYRHTRIVLTLGGCDSGILTLTKKGKITFTNLGNIL